MKSSAIIRRSLMVIASFFMAVFAIAQNEIGVDINAKESSPWLWVVGGAVFILLLVALMRGGSRSDA